MRAGVRRAAPSAKRSARPVLVAGELEVDARARTVRLGAERLDLTTVEFDLLEALAASAGQAVSREALVQRGLGRAISPFAPSIDTPLYNPPRQRRPLPRGGGRVFGRRRGA